ncbi:hypothetical protein [Romboutsia lituseburensis]|uniref:hypothetical protein n=1 Tax=Romboutsia lituseburensis TaxID=1537 RepID=UPI00215A0F7A|nr:hypothetical protein [Romboutsia lituseburensis]MCR8744936.1 hypothetical protein [Romboutsia lituseburensis]
MERWYKINVWLSVLGILIFVSSLIFLKQMPLFLLPAMFGLGMAFKGGKNIYKNEGPPKTQKSKKTDYNKKKKKK